MEILVSDSPFLLTLTSTLYAVESCWADTSFHILTSCLAAYLSCPTHLPSEITGELRRRYAQRRTYQFCHVDMSSWLRFHRQRIQFS
jgi:hypothetical protein